MRIKLQTLTRSKEEEIQDARGEEIEEEAVLLGGHIFHTLASATSIYQQGRRGLRPGLTAGVCLPGEI